MTNADTSNLDVIQAYYRNLDAKEFETLESLLADEFTQHRPDRTFKNPDQFLEFMRDERPHTDTTHNISNYFSPIIPHSADNTIAVRGTLCSENGERMLEFIDVVSFNSDMKIDRIETYTN